MNELESLFVELKTGAGNVYYYPNGGNAGDALINLGFYRAAEDCGLHYTTVNAEYDFSKLTADDTVILPGGGYIVSFWTSGMDLVQTLVKFDFNLLLLPQSVEKSPDILRMLRPNDYLFLREDISLEYAQSLDLKCKLARDHDLAFRINAREVLTRKTTSPRLSARTLVRIMLMGLHFCRSRFTKKVFSYRTDGEKFSEASAFFKLKIWSDLSLVAKFGSKDVEDNYRSAKALLWMISLYDVVYTDRLHVMIGSVLLEKETIVRPNAYHKILGVYNASIVNKPEFSKFCSLKKW